MATRRVSTLPSIESSQQAHIDDLVQRNRTLDHTVKKLKEQVEFEKTRARTAIQDIQYRWHAEQKQWREAVDTLQACHRIAYLRVQAQVETERKNVLMEQATRRKEQLAKVYRDTMITRFQIRESELERVIEEEEAKALEDRVLYAKETKALKGHVVDLVARLHAQGELIKAGGLAQDELQDQITELRKARAEKEVLSESIATQLERATLQLDNERSRNADLERSTDELKKKSEELKLQIDKSKSLETKGGAETEFLRKKKVELEVQVQALESRLSKREEDNAKSSEKLKNLQENGVVWQEQAEELESALEKLKAELKLANGEITKLRSALKTSGTTSKSSGTVAPSRKKANTSMVDVSEDDVEEVEEAIVLGSSPSAPTNSRTGPSSSNNPARRRREPSKLLSDGDENVQEVPFPTKAKGKARETTLESDNNHPKAKGTRVKTKPGFDARLEKRGPEDDSEIEEVPPPISANEKKVGKKGRTSSDEKDAELATVRKAKRRKQNGEEMVPNGNNKPRSKPKVPQSRAASELLAPSGVNDSASNLTKPKKRRINLYSGGSNDVPSFNFTGADAGGLNIPTILSPMREEEAPTSRPMDLLRLGFSHKR